MPATNENTQESVIRPRNLSWLVALCLAALFAIPHAASRYRASIRLLVSFDIAVLENINRPPALQIYYDQGKGFSEKDSIQVVLPERGIPKKIQAYLPVTSLQALRLDYLNGPGLVTIRGLSFSDPFGAMLRFSQTPSQFSLHQTKDLHASGNTLTLQTSADADDPNITLPFQPPLQAPTTGKLWPNLLFGIKIFLILGCAIEVLFFVLGKSWANEWLKKRTFAVKK